MNIQGTEGNNKNNELEENESADNDISAVTVIEAKNTAVETTAATVACIETNSMVEKERSDSSNRSSLRGMIENDDRVELQVEVCNVRD